MNTYSRYFIEEEEFIDDLYDECEIAQGTIIASRILISRYKDLIYKEINRNTILRYKAEINKLREDIRQAQAIINENTALISC